MDEPIGFWVRQVANDGAVIAVRALAHDPAIEPICPAMPGRSAERAPDRVLVPALD